MKNVLELLKNNVKATVTVVVLGVTFTFGWAKGCVVDVQPDVPTATEVK